MSAFSKADVQNVRVGVELNVRLWPKADIRTQSESVLRSFYTENGLWPGYSVMQTFNHRSAQVMSHSDTIKKILIAVGAVLLMVSNAFAETSREYLQTIGLKDLCIVYPRNHQGFWVASVKDPDGYFHTVTVGSYIGKNFGRVMKITNDTVEVIEIIPDVAGGYVERPLTLEVACPNIPPCANSPSDGSPIRWLRSKVEKIPNTDTYQTIHIGLSVGDRSAWRWVYADSRGIEPALPRRQSG